MIIESIHHSKYETRPFQEALQKAFTEDDYLFGGPRVSNSRTKVAVTATTSGSTSILANYNRYCASKRKSTHITYFIIQALSAKYYRQFHILFSDLKSLIQN